ncbi:hypothetical protein U729_3253 (plasmid) [Clostridium baratii str. Sullivan]|uniref:Uncharacterized protein n=1 Tax=Clostridium baratii str. Sullivan TaxID=1415775 RepID=A0A0A7G0I2_9CLOT|nr:hypothetical protein [Clostridium baratii]AIY85348.1 hypothetical protein U729_3253 [Clostridium baratii str. Sullivan]
MKVSLFGNISEVFDDVDISINDGKSNKVKFFTITDSSKISNETLSTVMCNYNNAHITVSCITFEEDIFNTLYLCSNKKAKVNGTIIANDKFTDIFEPCIPNFYESEFWVLVDKLEIINN